MQIPGAGISLRYTEAENQEVHASGLAVKRRKTGQY